VIGLAVSPLLLTSRIGVGPAFIIRRMLAPIAGILGAIITSLLMVVLLRTVRPTARQQGSRHILAYGTAMRGVGIAMLLLSGLFLYAASRSSLDQRHMAWIVYGMLATCGLYVFVEMFFVRIEFDESFIYPFSPWRGRRRIPWSDVVSCGYSNVNRWHVVRTRSHGTLRVSIYLSGIGSFLERLNACLHS